MIHNITQNNWDKANDDVDVDVVVVFGSFATYVPPIIVERVNVLGLHVCASTHLSLFATFIKKALR